jgi:enoyl-CoA hydratase/carnithine racemase
VTATVHGGDELLVHRQGAVVVLRMHRPARRNALSSALVAHLDAALDRAALDPGVRAVVLAGAPPGFCAGSDLKELAGLPHGGVLRHEADTARVARAVQRIPVPVIAAVEGFALGGGFLLATACDVVVSAADARWHLPEARLGWVPPWGLESLVTRAGPAAAKMLAWGDQPRTGADLYRLGVVDEVTEPDGALDRACAWAGRLAALPAHAVASTKHALADAVAGRAEAVDATTMRLFGEDYRSDAARSAVAAFASRPGRDDR